MGQVPLLVEPAPVVARRAVRAELAEVAAAGRKQPRRVGVLAVGERPVVGDLPAAGRRLRTAATVTVPAAPSAARTLVRASWTPSAMRTSSPGW